MKQNIYFVTGIDTDAGKSYATGYLARQWNEQGLCTITQKLVQTGNSGYSEDINLHRKLMGISYTEEDMARLTMPEIFAYPASPHLASRLENRPIDFDKIENATRILGDRYDAVLLEGAGGLMAPLTEDFLTIDYIKEKNYPVILVTSGRLGSINHTLLSLEAIARRNLNLYMVAYNQYPETPDQTISDDAKRFIIKYLSRHFPDTRLAEIPMIR
ncbi:MAG: dethiobiotin synthase [Tannerella sp.]|jgi:dethiobiotin synthetase|nr:dethiobiotin synthase [Tannerella sp.]